MTTLKGMTRAQVDAFFEKAFAPVNAERSGCRTLCVTNAQGVKKYIYNAKNIKGYIVSIEAEGVGSPFYEYDGVDGVDEFYEEYRPFSRIFFNSALISDRNKFQSEIKEKFNNHPSLESVLNTEYEKYLVKWSDNEGGMTVEVLPEPQSQPETEPELPENIDFGYFNGFSAYVLHNRLPKSVWAHVKPFATYHNGGEEDAEWLDDMGYYNVEAKDCKGWYYTKEALYALAKNGYKVSFNDVPVPYKKFEKDFFDGLDSAEKIHYDKKAAEKAEIQRKYNYREQVKKCFYELWHNARELTPEEVITRKIKDLPQITCKGIGVEGHNIYGGGIYLAEDDDNLYIVKNNGMDGDDWSRNNMNTGGAGAIVSVVQKEGLEMFVIQYLLAEIDKINNKNY